MPVERKRSWSERSKKELVGIHADLLRVCEKTLQISPHDFIITDGKRTIQEQKEHVRRGASKTMNSRHLYGLAVDFAALIGGKVRFEWAYMQPIAESFKLAARELNIPVVWGGDWRSFKDGCHIELDRKRYPDAK